MTSPATVLIVDDEPAILRLLRTSLAAEGYRTIEAATGADALARAAGADVVVLDLGLPDMDGLQVIARIRATSGVPIIVLSSREAESGKVAALDLGADDYVTKPFEPRELVARIRSILRRSGPGSAGLHDILRFGRLEIDRGSRALRLSGEDIPLTSHQYSILLAMAERAGRVLTREQIIEAAKGQPQDYDPAFDRSIDVHIGRIRAAIEDDAKAPRRIITVRGAGYVFAKAQD